LSGPTTKTGLALARGLMRIVSSAIRSCHSS
jgi:hypothetical protein